MIFAIIGVVFNLLLMVVIASSKELHCRRILIWLGIGISNILVLSSYVLMSQSVVWGSSSPEQSLCYWFVMLSVVVHMFNVLYAALERHICINYPEWHKTAVFSTISVILVQLTSYIPIFLVLGILNRTNFKEMSQPLTFGSYWHFQLGGYVFFILLLFCLCGQMALFRPKINGDKPSIETGNQQTQLNVRKPTFQTTSKSSTVLIGNNENSLLDFQAAKNFYFFVKLHLIFIALKLIPYIRILICLESEQLFPSENRAPQWSEAECFSFIKAFYYFSAFLDCVYSSIANPASFLFCTLIKEGRTTNTD